MKTSPETDLRTALEKLGAREFEIVALTMAPERGLAALRYALARGAEHPVPYAIKLFDNEDWHASGERHRYGTNLHASDGPPTPLPPPDPDANLEHARNLLRMLDT